MPESWEKTEKKLQSLYIIWPPQTIWTWMKTKLDDITLYLVDKVAVIYFKVSFKFGSTTFSRMFIQLSPIKFKDIQFNRDSENAFYYRTLCYECSST